MRLPIFDRQSCTFATSYTLHLRNTIHGLVYDIDAPPGTVRCSESSPPSVNSTLACRQLHAEMMQMYLTAYRHYFEKNKVHDGVPPW